MYQSTTDSGIQAVGPISFGSHFCQFYRHRQDLIDTLVPFFLAGLRNNEMCMWVTSEPLPAAEARQLMHEALPDFYEYVERGQIEICDFQDWYLRGGGTPGEVLQGWIDREQEARRRGFTGLRLTGNTFWLEHSGWDEFMAYERAVNEAFIQFRIIALCTYSLDRCRAEDVLDVCKTHQFALTRRQGEWELMESSSLKIAKEELTRLNQDLENRVSERTAEIQSALRARDEFLAMLAHELRNPLAPIRNASQVIRLLGTSDGNISWAGDVIERQVHQLSHLVDDLLDVSRVSRGKIELDCQDVDLATVVAQAVETSRPLIDSRGHQLSVSLPAEPIHLHADLTRVSQMIANLLNNAAKYMNDGGRIWLTGNREGDQVVLRIRDQGIGIPPEMLGRIFDLFTQVDRQLDRSEGGLGIGLALVRSLAELHGGSVEARSEGPGRGSELILRLPAREKSAPAPQEAAPGDEKKASGLAVLVVDDNLDSAESMARLLEIAGHEVEVAYDGMDALERARRQRPQAVLLDIGLPRLDGYEVARRLRLDPANRGLRIFAMTGYGHKEDRERSRAAGFDQHLVKPVDPAEVLALLAEPRQEP
ncbi:MAG TPA: MEDS domain-containing protein [Thermoanaerobaculia bacterium]|nr:MEDS domain-containing protein [Thermoanaerobaculia bacterium]